MSDTADDNERLRLLLQRELEKTREDMTRMAASAAETDGELQALAKRLSVREQELEAVIVEAKELRDEVQRLTAENASLKARPAAPPPPPPPPGLAERAVRKARRTAGKVVRQVRSSS